MNLKLLLPVTALIATVPLAVALVNSSSVAPAPAHAASAFTDGFPGAPGAPLPFSSDAWEVAYHAQWGVDVEALGEPSQAQHGPGCEAPGEAGNVTHTVTRISQLVYQCRDHVMTHVPDAGYHVIFMTPNQLADFGSGAATIRFDVSTVSRSARDWIDVWVQAWDTQEQLLVDLSTPTSQGNPRNAVHIEMGGGCCGFRSDGAFHVEVYDSGRNQVAEISSTGATWNSVLQPSAQARSTVEIVLSRSHIKVWMPQTGLVWVDQSIPTLNFSQGVVSFGHHSYSASKGEDLLTKESVGRANSWHWDNVSISPSEPFTIKHANKRAARWNDPVGGRTFTFGAPAPANTYLRFTAFGSAVRVGFDDKPATAATRVGGMERVEDSTSYFMRVPEGATRATFEMDPGYGFVGQVSNPTMFVRDGGANALVAGGAASILGSIPSSGIALLVVENAATAAQMVAALRSAGCPAVAVAVVERAQWAIYIPGAPAQVNAAFPPMVDAQTPFFVRCSG